MLLGTLGASLFGKKKQQQNGFLMPPHLLTHFIQRCLF